MEIQFDVPYRGGAAPKHKGPWFSLTEDEVNAWAARAFADATWRIGGDVAVAVEVHGTMGPGDAARITARVLAGLTGFAYRSEEAVARVTIGRLARPARKLVVKVAHTREQQDGRTEAGSCPD